MSGRAKPVRIGVAGAGFIGRRHLGFLLENPEFEVVGAADPSPEAASYLAGIGVPHFATWQEMFEKAKPEGILVATPNKMHEEVAVGAMEAGLPVLVEKPIADTLDAAQRIVAAADRTGVPVLVGHHRRHNPLMQAARAFIAEGGIGKIIAVSAHHLRRKPDPYYDVAWKRQKGGGPTLINGIHEIDCLRYLCGEISSVVAFAGSPARGFEVEDVASANFQFENGALGTLLISDAVEAPWAWEVTSGEEAAYLRQDEDCFHICGTAGTLTVPTLTHWRNENGGGRGDVFVRRNLFYTPADPWLEELRHFAKVIQGAASPLVTARDGLLTLAATKAVLDSAETGRIIHMKDLGL